MNIKDIHSSGGAHVVISDAGRNIADLSTGRSVQNKLYNAKELDTSNNLWWYDYGARQYDPTAPRFTTSDPLAEKYYPWNYFTYCMNNPVRFIDPDGRICGEPLLKVTVSVGLRFGVNIGKLGVGIDAGSYNYEYPTNKSYTSNGLSIGIGTRWGALVEASINNTCTEFDRTSNIKIGKFRTFEHVTEKESSGSISILSGAFNASHSEKEQEVQTLGGTFTTTEQGHNFDMGLYKKEQGLPEKEVKKPTPISHEKDMSISCILGIGLEINYSEVTKKCNEILTDAVGILSNILK